jgi:hypothetical protein
MNSCPIDSPIGNQALIGVVIPAGASWNTIWRLAGRPREAGIHVENWHHHPEEELARPKKKARHAARPLGKGRKDVDYSALASRLNARTSERTVLPASTAALVSRAPLEVPCVPICS